MMPVKPVFLSDKFTPARLPEVCAPRKSLLARFDEAAEDGFVFVSAQGGSGIGLSIVKAIMEAHHQQYGVVNHEDGVEFWFPLALASEKPEEEE